MRQVLWLAPLVLLCACSASHAAEPDTTPPKATVLLPIDKASTVNPLLAKAVLLLSEPMREPPTGTLALAVHDGQKWVDVPTPYTQSFNAATSEWKLVLKGKTFPARSVVRLTVTPKTGVDAAGNELAKKPIVWTFTTISDPLASGAGEQKGGCPLEEKPKAAALPCAEGTK